jgi:trehalose 6-phosphate synthase
MAQRDWAPAEGRGAAQWLRGRDVIVASQRGPVEHHLTDDAHLIERRGSGGVMCSFEALGNSVPFTWVAAPMTEGDRLIARRQTPMVVEPSGVHLRFANIPAAVQEAHYGTFCNRVLWFAQHGLARGMDASLTPEEVWRAWVDGYEPANLAFGRAVAASARSRDPVVFVQDYQLYRAPRVVRALLPESSILHFSHIPWPGPDAWDPVPPAVRRKMLRGLLGADILGFQDDRSAQGFLQSCQTDLPDAEVRTDTRRVRLGLRDTAVRVYPISVDPAVLRADLDGAAARRHRATLSGRTGEITIVRVDRVDPIKNIPLGFRAFGRLLERRPDLVGRAKFLAFLVPSRTSIGEYQREYADVLASVAEVNARFGRAEYVPIQVFYENNRLQALAGMSLADVVLVNSVADGMNLVAKEAPIVNDRPAALVLSTRTGAWTELGGAALGVDPHSIEGTAAALEAAISMPHRERVVRAAELRRRIESYDIWDWIDQQCADLGALCRAKLPHATPDLLAPA